MITSRVSWGLGLIFGAILAHETVGEYSYTRFPPHRPVVLHATHDKAHVLGGYFRFTPEGELISETRSVGIRIYKGGVWASGGGLPPRPLELGRLERVSTPLVSPRLATPTVYATDHPP